MSDMMTNVRGERFIGKRRDVDQWDATTASSRGTSSMRCGSAPPSGRPRCNPSLNRREVNGTALDANRIRQLSLAEDKVADTNNLSIGGNSEPTQKKGNKMRWQSRSNDRDRTALVQLAAEFMSHLEEMTVDDIFEGMGPLLRTRGLEIRPASDLVCPGQLVTPPTFDLTDDSLVMSPSMPRVPRVPWLDGARANSKDHERQDKKSSPDRIQFAMKIFYVNEGDPCCKLQVVRLGDRQSVCSVRYATSPKTAVAGKKYVHTEGVLVFSEGLTSQDVEIPLLEDQNFDTTLEFCVSLSEPHDCFIDPYLSNSRVKIIDDDCFPSNKFKEQLMRPSEVRGQLPHNVGNGPGKAGDWAVFYEYIKMNFRNNSIARRGSLKLMFTDQLKNSLSIMTMYLNMILVDRIIATPDKEEDLDTRSMLLVAITVLLILPAPIMHVCSYAKCFWKIGGASRMMLQTNLLRKYLAYDESVLCMLSESFLVQTTKQNVEDLVFRGYMQVFPIIKNLLSVFFIGCLQMTITPIGVAPIVIFPVLIFIFLKLRTYRTTVVLESFDAADKNLLDHVSRTAFRYRLLKSYHQRGEAVARFSKSVSRYNTTKNERDCVNVNNKFFVVWLSHLLTGFYTLLGAYYLMTETPYLAWLQGATLGKFLFTVSVFKSLGVSFAKIYESLMEIQSTFACLNNIVLLLNLPGEDPELRKIAASRLSYSIDAWQDAQSKKEKGFSVEKKNYFNKRGITRALDMIPAFTVQSLGVKCHDMKGAELQRPQISFEVMQGSIIVIMGRSGMGKNTLLNTLAGSSLPSQGYVMVPPHLNLLVVSSDPLFLGTRNLYENVCLGVVPGTPDGAPSRVRRVLERLHVPEKIVALAELANADIPAWKEFSTRTLQLINLARAFIANPDVMLLQTPVQFFGHQDTHSLMIALQEYVERRGFEHCDDTIHSRHPRTCVMTARMPEAAFENPDTRILILDEYGLRDVEFGAIVSGQETVE